MSFYNIPVGPPIITTETYGAIGVNSIQTGGSPSLSWNVEYNNNMVLDLPEDDGSNENFIIPFYIQPFNYIDIQTVFDSPVKLVIENCPPNWWVVRNKGFKPLTISPQTNGSSQYDPTNEYTLGPDSHQILAIMPGKPPVFNSLDNPSSFSLT